MRKFTCSLFAVLLLFLTGCNPVGDKSTSMSIIYLATCVLSLLLLIGYCCLVKKKTTWFIFLFTSVFIVNTGYFLLSVAKDINTALFANRLAYLSSVFLPMTMLMIMLNVTHSKYPKYLPYALSAINALVFLITASYPYLDIYYKDVSFSIVNGVGILSKTYGSWHSLYLVFLLAYFSAMIAVSIYTSKKKKLRSQGQTIVLTIAVFVNVCVWFLEQLVDIGFEFLSVSYIISELFLLGLYLAIESDISEKETTSTPVKEDTDTSDADSAQFEFFRANLSRLTPTEIKVYTYYVEGKTTKEIMELLNIKENTLKYHNKNIYSKLGVSSRKELLKFALLNLTEDN